jgi:uncharacterized LabA/DUF88 family protein
LVKAAILVDNMYFEHALFAYSAYPTDLSKLPKIVLAKEEEHYKTYVFDALPWVPDNPFPDQTEKRDRKAAYLSALKYKERIVVEYGHVVPKMKTCQKCGFQNVVPVQKAVDVQISVRLVSLAWNHIVDKIVLITGDADLVPAVNDVEKSGVIVKLAYIRIEEVGTSAGLIKVCPEKQELTPQDLQFLKYSGPP